MIGIPLGLVYANASEWFIHKHILHKLGKKRNSFWSFHYFEHHRASRSNNMIDTAYLEKNLRLDSHTKEAAGLLFLCGIHTPLLPIAPFFTATLWYSAIRYYRVHKRAHLDTDWGREHLPWHYDHHMGPTSEANWCVSRVWFDHIMNTRVRYAGTHREQKDYERRQKSASSSTKLHVRDA